MWQFFPIERPIKLSGLYTAFEEHLQADYVFRGETHDFYEIVLLAEGCLGITAGADSFLLDAPAAILHPPMEFHSLRAEQGTSPKIIIFSFSADVFPSLSNRIWSLSAENIKRSRRILELLQDATLPSGSKGIGTLRNDKKNEMQCALLELELLLLTLPKAEVTLPENDGSAGSRNYRRALRVMEENICRSLDTAELARLAHMSPSLLKKTFSRYAGVGVMEYFRTQKINAAVPLLRAGGSVQEVATKLGFSDAGYFSTVFRRVTGHTPSYYRSH